MWKILHFAGLISAAIVWDPEDSQVCYDYVGCFDNEYPWDCFHSRELPDDPAGMSFEYRRYTDENNYEVLDYRQCSLKPNLWPSLRRVQSKRINRHANCFKKP